MPIQIEVDQQLPCYDGALRCDSCEYREDCVIFAADAAMEDWQDSTLRVQFYDDTFEQQAMPVPQAFTTMIELADRYMTSLDADGSNLVKFISLTYNGRIQALAVPQGTDPKPLLAMLNEQAARDDG